MKDYVLLVRAGRFLVAFLETINIATKFCGDLYNFNLYENIISIGHIKSVIPNQLTSDFPSFALGAIAAAI